METRYGQSEYQIRPVKNSHMQIPIGTGEYIWCMTSCFRKELISISVKVKKAKTGFLFRQRPQWLAIFLIMTVDGIMTVKPVWQSMILTRQENR